MSQVYMNIVKKNCIPTMEVSGGFHYFILVSFDDVGDLFDGAVIVSNVCLHFLLALMIIAMCGRLALAITIHLSRTLTLRLHRSLIWTMIFWYPQYTFFIFFYFLYLLMLTCAFLNNKKIFRWGVSQKVPLSFKWDIYLLRRRLVRYFEQQFSVFKQYYMYFHTLFHPHIFSKNTNNVTKTTLTNGL